MYICVGMRLEMFTCPYIHIYICSMRRFKIDVRCLRDLLSKNEKEREVRRYTNSCRIFLLKRRLKRDKSKKEEKKERRFASNGRG